MLLQPGVIRRALDREVERDLDPRLLRRGDHRVEVVPGAEVGMDRIVPALFGPDRPRRADIGCVRRERVVPSLAVRPTYWVDRRQVHDVEAELGDPRQRLGDAAEASPGTREELVPSAEACELAVDIDLERRRRRLAVPVARLGGEALLDTHLAPEQLR